MTNNQNSHLVKTITYLWRTQCLDKCKILYIYMYVYKYLKKHPQIHMHTFILSNVQTQSYIHSTLVLIPYDQQLKNILLSHSNFSQKYESISIRFRLKFCSKIESSPWGQKIKAMSLSPLTSDTTSISQQRKNKISAINILQVILLYIYICIYIFIYLHRHPHYEDLT